MARRVSKGRPHTPAATVSDVFRPTNRYRSPVVWDLGLSALADAIRAGSVSYSRSVATAAETAVRNRSEPPQPRAPMCLVKLDEAKADRSNVLNRCIDIVPAETPGCR